VTWGIRKEGYPYMGNGNKTSSSMEATEYWMSLGTISPLAE